jgi:hypothetical protein
VEFKKLRLTDAEVARGFVAQVEALGDGVVGVGLLGGFALGDLGELGGRDERAFESDGIEAERGLANPSHLDVPRNEDEDAEDVGGEDGFDGDAWSSAHGSSCRADALMIGQKRRSSLACVVSDGSVIV